MAVKEILVFGDKALRQKCARVEEIDDEIKSLIKDMKDTMLTASGAGLAASQVGVLKQVIVVKIPAENDTGEMKAMINPEILAAEGTAVSEEGCLSIPGITETVKRHAAVDVSYMTEDGEETTVHAVDFLSRVLQHEIDHLNGILFIDRLGIVRRDMIKRRLKKQLGKKERVKT